MPDVRGSALFLTLACLAAIAPARAGDLCPAAPPRALPEDTAAAVALADHKIHIESDSASLDANGDAAVSGRVVVRQDDRSVSADKVGYEGRSGKIDVEGKVDFEDPAISVRGTRGSFDTVGNAAISNAQFDLLNRSGRGTADRVALTPDGRLDLSGVSFTTCPPGNRDWLLRARSISIDSAEQEGSGRNVRLEFEGVPLLYTPYLSFPVGDARKTGLLFPIFGGSSSGGFQFSMPYYFNLAPNYDLTLTPGIQTARGVELGGEFRYLTEHSHGIEEANILPDDAVAKSNRTYVHLKDVTDFNSNLRLDADAASVSDVNYFQDFAVGSEATSVTYLERRADLLYRDDAWSVHAQLQNFQTIDQTISAIDRPYSQVPRVQALGSWPLLGGGFEFGLNAEAVNFIRDIGAQGLRLDVAPEIRYSFREPGYFFEPSAGWRYTQYDLHDLAPGGTSTPMRELPYFRVDSGLVFERASGSEGQRLQTLEPEIAYTFVPYRNQDALPIFDSGLPDLNIAELFRTNRFVGADRVGDANQLSVAMTSRLFDQANGAQYLAATLGQTRYFKPLRVTLPGEPPQSTAASGVVGQLDLTAYKNLNLNLDYEWDPERSQTLRSEVALQYRADADRTVNLSYRFRRDLLEQWDGSFGWPIGRRWNAVGRMVYSIRDHQIIEQVAGLEYKSCCWRVRLVQRRYVSTRTGQLENAIALQLELTGLSSVRGAQDSFLERTIRGYSGRNVAP